MRKIFYSILFCSFIIAGCNKELPIHSEDNDGNFVEMKLNIGGEITEDFLPLTKSDDNDLFGIIVEQRTNSSSSYTDFAAGLFDSIDDISLFLKEGSTYRIRARLFKDGKTKIEKGNSYKSSNSSSNEKVTEGYMGPFGITQTSYKISNLSHYKVSWGTSCKNRFGYKNNERWHGTISQTSFDWYFGYSSYIKKNGLSSSKDILYTNKIDYFSTIGSYEYDGITYFYENVDYVPIENGTLNIGLKHMAYGLKYSVSGLTDGYLTLSIKQGYKFLYKDVQISANGEGGGDVFPCTDIISAYNYPDTYTETVTISLKWMRGIGIEEDLKSVDIKLKRNKMNNIRINLSGTDESANMKIETETTVMSNENVTINLK